MGQNEAVGWYYANIRLPVNKTLLGEVLRIDQRIIDICKDLEVFGTTGVIAIRGQAIRNNAVAPLILYKRLNHALRQRQIANLVVGQNARCHGNIPGLHIHLGFMHHAYPLSSCFTAEEGGFFSGFACSFACALRRLRFSLRAAARLSFFGVALAAIFCCSENRGFHHVILHLHHTKKYGERKKNQCF